MIFLLPQLFTIATASDTLAAISASTTPERKVGRKYPVEVVSTKMVESRVEGGEVTTIYEYTVRISRETILKMIQEDWASYECIAYISGRGAADKWLRQKIEKATNGPSYVELNVMMVKHGEGCIMYSGYLWKDPEGSKRADPVNLLFCGQGTSQIVKNHMKNDIDYLWGNSQGFTFYEFINDAAHGGPSLIIEPQDYQLGRGPFFGSRYHIRIFAGTYDTHGVFDYWSVAGVHHEVWKWRYLTHVVDGWETAEQFVRDDFSDEPFVDHWEFKYEAYEGYHQGYYNDGYSTAIFLES